MPSLNMAALQVPSNGLLLENSANDSLPLQAFGITLDDSVIEDMIRCVQGRGEIELTLGKDPSFTYGSHSEPVVASPESFGFDIYQTNLDESDSKTEKLPYPTMSILSKPPNSIKSQSARAEKAKPKSSSRASSSGPESERSVNGKSKLVNTAPKDVKQRGKTTKSAANLVPPGKKAMSTVLSGSNNRSLPPSPALPGVSSPNPADTLAHKVQEKKRKERSILVHELAARDRSFEHLQNAWMGTEADLKPTLEKVANYNNATQQWSLHKPYWKELDVWQYDFDSPDDRQSAIDNAVRQFDKQRMGTSSPEWEKLLPPEDRGKGIILSKLQANIAKGAYDRPKIQKPEDGSKSDVDSSKAKGEAMARSASQPTGNKTKKAGDLPTKRLLSSNPKKTPAPVKKPIAKVKAADDKAGKRVLSDEFVVDSSSSEDEAMSAKPKPQEPRSKPIEKPVEKPAEKPSKPAEKPKAVEKPKAAEKPKPAEKPKLADKPKPIEKPRATPAPATKAKPTVRAPRSMGGSTGSVSQKRPREEDESSSSSGTPLSKRLKQPKDASKTGPVSTGANGVKPRVPNGNQAARGSSQGTGSSTLPMKPKNTSPVKSSPLASSPPTNASDFEDSQQTQRPSQRSQPSKTNGLTNGVSSSASKKRKELESQPAPSASKKAKVSKDVLARASYFAQYYDKYATLHREIEALANPPENKLNDLIRMRNRLVSLKSEISRTVAASA